MKQIIGAHYIKRDRFDFEIGYLRQSPCISCDRKEDLPGCSGFCEMIIRLQETLAAGISCSKF
ncbi:hypothetical protein [Desulforegula conservatrix]|uniref:hypothetical protein n=1 Tax=Desulforegula conservatrix TaxID=153026 RepID=UPI0003FEFF92|nr:hypothetical protein [Desulforegula conservatrix]